MCPAEGDTSSQFHEDQVPPFLHSVAPWFLEFLGSDFTVYSGPGVVLKCSFVAKCGKAVLCLTGGLYASSRKLA